MPLAVFFQRQRLSRVSVCWPPAPGHGKMNRTTDSLAPGWLDSLLEQQHRSNFSRVSGSHRYRSERSVGSLLRPRIHSQKVAPVASYQWE